MFPLLVWVGLLTTSAIAPGATDVGGDVRQSTENAALQNLKLYFDGNGGLVRVVTQHLDERWTPEPLRNRLNKLVPGKPFTHFKRSRTAGKGYWHKMDAGGADLMDGQGCELHAPEGGDPEAFTECIIGHAEVPPALLAHAQSIVPGGTLLRSKRIVRDSGRTTYALDVAGDGGVKATLFVGKDGVEFQRRLPLDVKDLAPAIAGQIGALIPGGTIAKTKLRHAKGAGDEVLVEVRRGAAVHNLRFAAAGGLLHHEVLMPAVVSVEAFRVDGYVENDAPY